MQNQKHLSSKTQNSIKKNIMGKGDNYETATNKTKNIR